MTPARRVNVRDHLVDVWDRLEDRYGAAVTRQPVDEMTDVEARIALFVAGHRMRCLVEGEAAGWWPQKGRPR